MKCLILILGEKLSFVQLDECSTSFADGAGNKYKSIFPDDDNGFYDWLRCTKGSVIGVRWFPHESASLKSSRAAYLKKLEYVDVGKDFSEISIYFSDFREIDEPNSCDQDFCQNQMYFSKNGRCAISFSLDNLSGDQNFPFNSQ